MRLHIHKQACKPVRLSPTLHPPRAALQETQARLQRARRAEAPAGTAERELQVGAAGSLPQA